MNKLLLPLILLFISLTINAHPHTKVKQQALVSIGINRLELTIRIIPSYDEGADIYRHLDTDKNGELSQAEQYSFATKLLQETAISLDTVPLNLQQLSVNTSDKNDIISGHGHIEIKASAKLALSIKQTNRLMLAVNYEELSHHWFIQPFLYRDIKKHFTEPKIKRFNKNNDVIVILKPRANR